MLSKFDQSLVDGICSFSDLQIARFFIHDYGKANLFGVDSLPRAGRHVNGRLKQFRFRIFHKAGLSFRIGLSRITETDSDQFPTFESLDKVVSSRDLLTGLLTHFPEQHKAGRRVREEIIKFLAKEL